MEDGVPDGVVVLPAQFPLEDGGVGLGAVVLRGRGCGGCRGLDGRLAGVGLVADDLSGGAVPVDLKAHLFSDVPELDVVVAVDGVGLHLHLLTVHIDWMGRPLGLEKFRGGVGHRSGQSHAHQDSRQQGRHVLSSVFHVRCLLCRYYTAILASTQYQRLWQKSIRQNGEVFCHLTSAA